MFDSSVAKGREPLEFQLGKGKVIKGNFLTVFLMDNHKNAIKSVSFSSLVGYNLRPLDNNFFLPSWYL